jgi:hypothetical protein
MLKWTRKQIRQNQTLKNHEFPLYFRLSYGPPLDSPPSAHTQKDLGLMAKVFFFAESGLDDFAGGQNRTAELCEAARRDAAQDVPRSTRQPGRVSKKGPATYVTSPLKFVWRNGRDSTILQEGKIGRRSYAKPPEGAWHRTCRDQPGGPAAYQKKDQPHM